MASVKVGQRFVLERREYEIVSVSENRAHCVPVNTETVTIVDRRTGRKRTFVVRDTKHAIDISPNSAIDLLGELLAPVAAPKRSTE